MASPTRRYNKEEFARRGDAIYEMDVRSQLDDSRVQWETPFCD